MQLMKVEIKLSIVFVSENYKRRGYEKVIYTGVDFYKSIFQCYVSNYPIAVQRNGIGYGNINPGASFTWTRDVGKFEVGDEITVFEPNYESTEYKERYTDTYKIQYLPVSIYAGFGNYDPKILMLGLLEKSHDGWPLGPWRSKTWAWGWFDLYLTAYGKVGSYAQSTIQGADYCIDYDINTNTFYPSTCCKEKSCSK